MIGTIECLLEGDERVVGHFAAARAFWVEFFESHRSDDDETLSKAIGHAQSRHEMIFGGDRYLGKECMPYTALGTLYDTGKGFENNRSLAVRVVTAFMVSFVSLEVKGAMRDAAVLYNLDEEPELAETLRRW